MNKQELKQLQKELGLSDSVLYEIEQDLLDGDDLLNSLPVEPLSPNLVRSINSSVSAKLNKPNRVAWLRRIAAVVVIAFVSLSVVVLTDDRSTAPQHTPLINLVSVDPEVERPAEQIEADRQLWEFALTMDEQASYDSSENLDTQTVTDLLLLFEDAQVSTEHPVGMDNQKTMPAGIV